VHGRPSVGVVLAGVQELGIRREGDKGGHGIRLEVVRRIVQPLVPGGLGKRAEALTQRHIATGHGASKAFRGAEGTLGARRANFDSGRISVHSVPFARV
jgi:hypothetical protein